MPTFLWGEEDFLLWQNIRSLKENFINKNPRASVTEFDFEESFDINEITRTLHQGSGLFSQKGLFIGKNIFAISSDQQEKFLAVLLSLSLTDVETEIVLSQIGNVTKYKKSKLGDFLFRKCKMTEFKKFQLAQMKKWVAGETIRLSNKKVKINEDALDKLLSVSNGNLWFLNSEITKLIDYSWDRGIIEKKDIEDISYGKIQSKIFDLVDAIGQKNRKRTLDLISSLLLQGENAFYIFTMIAFQIRNLAKVFNFQGKDANLLSKKIGMHPFVIKKTQSQLKNFSSREIRRAYGVIAKFDYEMKTGRIEAEKALYNLAISI